MGNETKVIYDGPSLIDGERVIVLAQRGSRNSKTGDMLQTYILRADVDPITASRTGQDYSICGSCPHRGEAHDGDKGQAKGRTCYVTLAHGPLGKWKAWSRGLYETIEGHKDISAFGRGYMVRIGTYGDGAVVPPWVWESLVSEAEGHTAYSHQSGLVPVDQSMYMISVESKEQATKAWNTGARTFRVVPDVGALVKGKEILCPASEEMGKRATCLTCKLCSGTKTKAKSIAIVAHGTAKRKAKELVA